MMRLERFLFASIVALAGCDDGTPPPLGDSDGGLESDGTSKAPCSTPATGCPCAEAGAQFYCGVVYRYSGTHVDCSPGYLTCQDDGGWGDCVGDTIFDGQ